MALTNMYSCVTLVLMLMPVNAIYNAHLMRVEVPATPRPGQIFGQDGIATMSCDANTNSFDHTTVDEEVNAVEIDKHLTQVPGVWEYVKSQAGKNKDAAASVEEMTMLSKAVLWYANKFGKTTLQTAETGFAQGHSALAFLATEIGAGFQTHHTALDPYQETHWQNHGNNAVKDLFQHYPSAKDHVDFTHVALPAAVGLGDMMKKGGCIDVGFMDDGHKFDDNMAELWYFNHMMPVGGILMLDDSWMGSVKATMSFIETNLPFYKLHSNGRYAIYVKTGTDSRKWDHFEGFVGNAPADHEH